MLMLRRELGGDAWLRRFFQALARCPEVRADTPQGALRQGLIWLVAASTAAGRDVLKVFVERWHLPMGKAIRKALASVNWKRADPAAVLAGLPVSFEP